VKWPKELFDVFSVALEVEPIEGRSKRDVLQAMFDEVARRATWRAKGNPADVHAALTWPYTPLGSVVNEFMVGQARSLTLHGTQWGQAVEALHTFIETHAAEVFAEFADQPSPYGHELFGPSES
jgi:hypothetical protein